LPPDLVVFGNLLVDDVVRADGTTRMGEAGGASLHLGLGAALWGLRVGVVTYRGDGYPDTALTALAARGVDLAGVHARPGPGLRAWLLYEGTRRRVIHHEGGPTHTEVSPTSSHLPAAWRGARAFHIAPMPFAIQQELVAALAPHAELLSLDPHLPLRPATLDVWRETAARVDVFFASEDEVFFGNDPRPQLESLVAGRLRVLAYKRGARGGSLFDGRSWQDWPAVAGPAIDTTGAGDAFAAGFLAGWLAGENPARAARRGAVGASFAVEGWGAAGLLEATPERAEARLREASR
jgi:sugar/nucleoside kinase (ribokinase family)